MIFFFRMKTAYVLRISDCSSDVCSSDLGRRRATANARVLIHQPWAGQFQGQATDLERAAEEILRQRARIDQLLADATGQPVERIHRDTERDTYNGRCACRERVCHSS